MRIQTHVGNMVTGYNHMTISVRISSTHFWSKPHTTTLISLQNPNKPATRCSDVASSLESLGSKKAIQTLVLVLTVFNLSSLFLVLEPLCLVLVMAWNFILCLDLCLELCALDCIKGSEAMKMLGSCDRICLLRPYCIADTQVVLSVYAAMISVWVSRANQTFSFVFLVCKNLPCICFDSNKLHLALCSSGFALSWIIFQTLAHLVLSWSCKLNLEYCLALTHYLVLVLQGFARVCKVDYCLALTN